MTDIGTQHRNIAMIVIACMLSFVAMRACQSMAANEAATQAAKACIERMKLFVDRAPADIPPPDENVVGGAGRLLTWKPESNLRLVEGAHTEERSSATCETSPDGLMVTKVTIGGKVAWDLLALARGFTTPPEETARPATEAEGADAAAGVTEVQALDR